MLPTIAVTVETTGIPRYDRPAEDSSQPAVCSLGAVIYDGQNELARLSYLIKPEGWQVPAEAAAIHGLTTQVCERYGAPARDVAAELVELIGRARRAVMPTAMHFKMLRGFLRKAEAPAWPEALDPVYVMPLLKDICKVPPTAKMAASGRRDFKIPAPREAARILFDADLDPLDPGRHAALLYQAYCLTSHAKALA